MRDDPDDRLLKPRFVFVMGLLRDIVNALHGQQIQYTVLVVDFSDPMRIVEARRWLDLNGDIDSGHYDEINFIKWNEDTLVCDTGVFSKNDLIKRIGRLE